MPLPGNGTLSLQGHSKPGDALPSKPKQAMIVRMSVETLDALEAFPNQPPMEFAFGKSPGIYIGETFFPMRPLKEGSPHELYLRSSSAAKPMAPLKLYANVTGKFTVERELGEKVQDKVRDRTQVAEKQRTERKVQMLDSPPQLPQVNGKKRKAPSASSSLLKKAAHNDHIRNVSSASTVPSRVASPLPPAAATPSAPTTPKESSVRRRMVQYLAINSRSTDEVMRAIGGADCDSAKRRALFEILDEVAEPDASVKKGDKSPRLWILKTATWLEVRPYQWKLTEQERTTMARNARLALKTLKIPEADPVWDNVRYRSTTAPSPASQAAAGANSSSKGTTPGVNPSSSSSSSKPEAKRGVMSKEAKEKRAKVKMEGPKPKTEVQMKDESAKASGVTGRRAKEPTESPASRPASLSQEHTKRLPGLTSKAPKVPSQLAVTGSSADTPMRPATPADPRPSQRDSISSTNSLQHKPSPAPSAHERKPSSTSTMRISKKVTPSDKDKEKVEERNNTPTTTNVKRKKPSREENYPDEDMVRKANLQKKRRVEEGALLVTGSSTSKEQRPRDLSPPKKLSTDLSPPARQKATATPSSLLPARASAPSQSSSSVPPSSSSSKPRAPSDKDRPAKANGGSKPRPRAPIYTSSEDEGEITQVHRGEFSSSTLPDFISNPRPRPPLPPAWDHVALRKRYNSSYQEYITVFSLIIAQKSQIESMLKSDSDAEGGVELLETKELARVASQHHSLKDELESIKSIFLTGKLPGEVSPRSD